MSPARNLLEEAAYDIITVGEAKRKSSIGNRKNIELLPSQFQESLFCEISAIICHDLHVYDVPWKYKNVEQLRALFKSNMQQASAVVTEFPRTYYRLEAIANITVINLFLTESPLLLDTSAIGQSDVSPRTASKDVSQLIYPAQLQEHKNHKKLILAVEKLTKAGQPVNIICPGTDFNESISDEIRSFARQRGVDQEIEFPGRLSDEAILGLYNSCDGVIIPSLAEGGAYVAFEAIAAGKPVAVSKIESAEMHLKAVQGKVLWFDPDIETDVTDAVDKLTSADPNVWYERNTVARKRISEMTWDGVGRKWNVLIDWLIGNRDRPIIGIDKDGWGIDYK